MFTIKAEQYILVSSYIKYKYRTLPVRLNQNNTVHYWNISNITAKHPVLLSLCNQEDLDEAIIKAGGTIDSHSDESLSTND